MLVYQIKAGVIDAFVCFSHPDSENDFWFSVPDQRRRMSGDWAADIMHCGTQLAFISTSLLFPRDSKCRRAVINAVAHAWCDSFVNGLKKVNQYSLAGLRPSVSLSAVIVVLLRTNMCSWGPELRAIILLSICRGKIIIITANTTLAWRRLAFIIYTASISHADLNDHGKRWGKINVNSYFIRP